MGDWSQYLCDDAIFDGKILEMPFINWIDISQFAVFVCVCLCLCDPFNHFK